MHLGLAFEAVDDLLGIWGRPETTGKPVAGDVGPKTLPVVAALAELSGGSGSQGRTAINSVGSCPTATSLRTT